MSNLRVKTERYIKALTTYGITPILVLLDEYERADDFEECSIIRDAIQERIDRVNKISHVGEDFDVPRRLEELDSTNEMYEFTAEENYQRNLKNYVLKIKEIVNGELHSK